MRNYQDMNSNNWLSFPFSPPDPSLQTHLTSSADHSQQFSLGLVTENDDSPFQHQGKYFFFSHTQIHIESSDSA